jgi:flagellar assembly protein FliH
LVAHPSEAVTDTWHLDESDGIARGLHGGPVGREAPDPEAAGYARGLADGERLALQSAAAHTVALAGQLRTALAGLEDFRVGLLERSETRLVTAALAIARRVLRQELRQEPALLRSLARAAIDTVRGAVDVRVVVHPLDLEAVRPDVRPEVGPDVRPPGAAPSGASVLYVADDRVDRGSCRVESSFGEIEAGLEAQLAEIGRGFAEGGDVENLTANMGAP